MYCKAEYIWLCVLVQTYSLHAYSQSDYSITGKPYCKNLFGLYVYCICFIIYGRLFSFVSKYCVMRNI